MARAGYEHDTAAGGGIEYYMERGYVPQGIDAPGRHKDSGSMTLEYAFCDWCLSRMADALGKTDDAGLFLKRSLNYRTIWDAERRFMRPRCLNGSWLDPFDPMAPTGWCEANGRQYLWWVPHDVAGLAELMGGRETFTDRLNTLFDKARPGSFIAPHGRHHENYMDYGNQPSTHLAHLFNHAGAPWLTQKWVREVVDTVKSGITPHSGYGGDEDQGLMGSLNVLMMTGLFQMRAGCDADPVYEITAPMFEAVRIRLDPRYYDAPELLIETEGDPETQPYIQSATLNGRELAGPWIRHSDIVRGAHLVIRLGSQPNTEWGAGKDDGPPSTSEGRL
jgi:predicted alpha-1,2-mannosidase